MTDGTFKGALRAALPHAGGVKAARQGMSWLIVEQGVILATDRFTMARAAFDPEPHAISGPVYLPPLQARLLLALEEPVLDDATEGTLSAVTPEATLRLARTPEVADVRKHILRLLDKDHGSYDESGVAYKGKYLTRLSASAVGKVPVEIFPHGPGQPTTFRVGEYLDGAIQPVRMG